MDEVENHYEKTVYEPSAYFMPEKRRKTLGGKKYPMLNFGPDEWMGSDLDFPVGNSCLYGGAEGRSWGKGTRLYTLEEAMIACPAVGMELPSAEDWQDLLAFAAGNDDGRNSEQGFNKHRAFGRLTVSEGIGFDVGLNGYGFYYGNGEKGFDGFGKKVYYWTSSYDGEYPLRPLVIAFDISDASVVRYRVSEPHKYLYACRCISRR